MSEKDEFDLEFDEEFLKGVDTEEELYYSQCEPLSKDQQVATKRRRLESPPEPCRPTHNLSSRKHHILTIFSSSSNSPVKSLALATLRTSPLPTEIFKTPQRSPSVIPRSSSTVKTLLHKSKNSTITRTSDLLKKTLVRKFPGPAGLLPDAVNPSNSPESLKPYLSLFDEHDSTTTSRSSPEKLNDFCTQDTKKSFLEGAWLRMMDSLPTDFLQGYDIASIKGTSTKRIPRLAVVIQKIDQAGGNPRVILKDLSGSIEGMMHRDLAINHPNILHSGIVLLLQDVGILSSKKTFIRTRTVMFSTDNLVGAFSEKGIVVRTPLLDAISSGNYEKVKSKVASKSTKRIRQWGEQLRIEMNSSQEKMEFSLRNRDGPIAELIDQPGKFINSSVLCGDLNRSVSVELSRKVEVDGSSCKDFCEEDFNFEDDLFNEIDVSQFDDAKGSQDKGSVIEAVAVIEHGVGGEEEEGGIGDDLLNSDTDTDDEYLSQIDLETIANNASLNN
ncbi:uncharacterized protein C17orf53 [Fopius arisanus]|uniref:CQ053_1 protein n=2 Tax=Fopius arisanus TaxID=64838 RepID=A0A0C9REH1_9HYME|nr:PREDICTED: uncharacterized protein C17orf53-like [Fopius arisanus]